MKKAKRQVGKILVESLTTDQIILLLDIVFSTGDIDRFTDRLKNGDSDMAETVIKVLEMDHDKGGKPPVGRVASDQKIVEYWNALWNHWDSLVLEVGDEEGKYAVQEEHWEPPYFDGSALAYDLDEVAADMLGLIDDVYDLVDNPDLFAEALDEINSSISFYPDWMGVEYNEGCVLGKNATSCILKWLWFSSQNDAHIGKAFLDKVCEIEDQCNMVDLDKNARVNFFAELPTEVCREIYGRLKNNDRTGNLDNVYSGWHKIYHLFEKRFDSGAYLETCRKHLAVNWQYGRPLIDDAVNRGNYQEAETLLEKTFSSYLRKKNNATWYPETSLLLNERCYYYEDNREDVFSLLELWANVSKKLGNSKRSAASEFQGVIFRAPEDWDAIISNYRKQQNQEAKKAIDLLFIHWQTEMARRSIGHFLDDSVSSDTWIHWLIKADLDATGKRAWFTEKLNGWLAQLKEDRSAFGDLWPRLARLTKDLPGSGKLKKLYPSFFKIVLPEDSEASLLGKARCKGLQEMNAGPCLSAAMDVWKNNLSHIVPDPKAAYKSDYDNHAQWMKALYELSHESYDRVLAEWREKHKLRRNLWRDMKNNGLPT